MRRHNSAPSISGMDQSEMTTADWRVRNTLQASAPLVVAVTSYPSPLSAAFRYRPATGSSSTRRTCMGGSAVTQVVEDRRHLAFQRREFPLDVLEHALPGGALDFREQQCEPARADGARRRLERVRGAPDRLGIPRPSGRLERREALGRGLGEHPHDPVHRFFGSSLTHGAAEALQVDGRRRRRRTVRAPFDEREQLVRLERLGEVPAHPGGETALPLTAQGVRGEGDDRERPALRQGADAVRGGEAVHLGHLDVHEDHVVAAGAGCGPPLPPPGPPPPPMPLPPAYPPPPPPSLRGGPSL